jgi:hypothetical protein
MQLEAAGHVVYNFKNSMTSFRWEDIDPNLDLLEKMEHPLVNRAFQADQAAMFWVEACVMVQPCGISAGIELGWFAGKGVRTIVLLDPDSPPDTMLKLADHLCVTIEEVLEALKT